MPSTDNYYAHLNIDINYDVLRLESEMINYRPLEIKTFQAQSTWFEYAPTWKYGRCDGYNNQSKRYVKKLEEYFTEMFDAFIVPNFIKQDANTEVPMHSDSGTICSVNIMLEDDCAPITFEDIGDVYYKCAFVNVGKRHMVKAWPEERILLKYSIKDRSYEDCLRRIPDSLRS